jgi:uncharacterized OB-fold protein
MTERYFPDGMPPPMADGITLPWWQAAAEHRLLVQRCGSCGHSQLPPSPICSECRSEDTGWHEVSGRGELYTYTVVHRPIAAGQELPYVIGVISLEGSGGVRMISNIVEVDPESLSVGMPLEVAWEDMSDDLAIPRFRPRAD